MTTNHPDPTPPPVEPAPSQAQLAEVSARNERLGLTAIEANARLEAVRAVRDEWQAALIHNRRPAPIAMKAAALIVSQLDAALSAAPQPEPEREAFVEQIAGLPQGRRAEIFEPPASDESARCEHGETEAHVYGEVVSERDAHWRPAWCPGPAASGTPDGGP